MLALGHEHQEQNYGVWDDSQSGTAHWVPTVLSHWDKPPSCGKPEPGQAAQEATDHIPHLHRALTSAKVTLVGQFFAPFIETGKYN